MGTAGKPPGKAMYVAPRPDWDWLRIEQRKLYTRSEQHVDYVFRKLWGLVTDPRNLRMALARVAGNRGRRTAGVDGITVVHVTKRTEVFIAELRAELRSNPKYLRWGTTTAIRPKTIFCQKITRSADRNCFPPVPGDGIDLVFRASMFRSGLGQALRVIALLARPAEA